MKKKIMYSILLFVTSFIFSLLTVWFVAHINTSIMDFHLWSDTHRLIVATLVFVSGLGHVGIWDKKESAWDKR